MATPKLKIGGASDALRQSLSTKGTLPTGKVRLKGINGKTIQPKVKAPAEPAPAPAEEAVDTAAAEAAAAAAAEAQAAAEAEAAAAAEAERQAQEEYERQMEEYNRQMEEYNRQMAEYQAAQEAEAAAAAAEAEPAPEPEPAAPAPEASEQDAQQTVAAARALADAAPAPKPAGKLRAAKPVGKAGALVASKPKAAGVSPLGAAPKKKKKAAPKPEPAEGEEMPPEEELSAEEEAAAAARDAYLTQLQKSAEATPVWKKVPFMIGVGVLVLGAIGCTWYVMTENAKQERIKAHRAYIDKLIRRAQEINQKGVEDLAGAKAKGVDVTCSRKDAKALMEVIVDPFVKSETGTPLYGRDPIKTVCYNSCLLLGIAAEEDPEICKYIFDIAGKKCDKIESGLFRWLLQRIAIAGNNDVNTHLRKLAETVNAKPDWATKNKCLAAVWECIGMRVGQNDVPEIIALLSDEKTDGQLANTLCICLDNILRMMDDSQTAAKASIGDQMFDGLPEKLRRNCSTTMAKACSTKALDFYKNELKDKGTWKKGVGLTFISYWGDDSILDYVLELQESAKGDAALEQLMTQVIATVFRQNRERTDDAAEKLLKMFCSDPFADTAALQDLINKTDPDSTLYIGPGAELDKLMEKRTELEKIRKEKLSIIKNLSSLRDYKWVMNLLNRYSSDKDEDVKYAATHAKEQVEKNTAEEMKARDVYKSRNQ